MSRRGAQQPGPEIISTDNRLVCRGCGITFSEDRRQGRHKDYIRTAKGTICRDQKSCRQRQLTTEIGIDLHSRNPRERLIARMDRRPENWKAIGWRAAYTEVERVEAAVEYFSWCWPVGLAYAVQIDEDDELVKSRGKFVPHTQKTLAAFLGMAASNVNRAIQWMRKAGRIRDDDRGLALNPKPFLTLEMRNELAPAPSGGGDEIVIPAKYRKALDYFLANAHEEISDPATEKAEAYCAEFNGKLKELRKHLDSEFEALFAELSAAVGKPWEGRKRGKRTPKAAAPPRISPAAAPDPFAEPEEVWVHAAENGAAEVDAGVDLNDLYAAGLGKGALAKLPRPRPEVDPFPTDQTAAAVRDFLVADDDAIQALVRKCREVQPGCNDAEIAWAVRAKGKIAQRKDNPAGFLMTAVSNHFKGGGYRQLQELVRGVEEQAARELRHQQARLYNAAETYLADPDSSPEDIAWAREILGIKVEGAGGAK